MDKWRGLVMLGSWPFEYNDKKVIEKLKYLNKCSNAERPTYD